MYNLNINLSGNKLGLFRVGTSIWKPEGKKKSLARGIPVVVATLLN